MLSVISSSVKGVAITGIINKLRHILMPFIVLSLGMSIVELIKFILARGSIPEHDTQALIWIVICLAGSVSGFLGTFMLRKGFLLAASILFCCLMAPLTPNMIFLTNGE